MEEKQTLLPDEVIINKIYLIRSQKVMLDSDLAELYGVETKRLNEQVKRNIERFHEDFMFQLTEEEFDKVNSLRSQNATLNEGRGKHRKYLPYIFSEHGVLMLSNILNSKRAIKVSIQIIRIFTRMREILLSHKDIFQKLEELQRNDIAQDEKIKLIFKYLDKFEKTKHEELEQANRQKIGFLNQ